MEGSEFWDALGQKYGIDICYDKQYRKLFKVLEKSRYTNAVSFSAITRETFKEMETYCNAADADLWGPTDDQSCRKVNLLSPGDKDLILYLSKLVKDDPEYFKLPLKK